ncbi:MAG: TonB-dependent receptor plug domain-containing protein [Fibrobacterota bacterium]
MKFFRVFFYPAVFGVVSLCGAQDFQLDSLNVKSVRNVFERTEHPGARRVLFSQGSSEQFLSRVLALQPGVESKLYGGTGSFETISLRGIPGKGIAFYLDGLPLNDHGSGYYDLSELRGYDIAAAEIYTGRIPAAFSTQNLGGAINFVTAAASSNAGEIMLGAGSFGEKRARSHISKTGTGDRVFNAAVEYHEADNDFPYLDRGGTPHDDSNNEIKTLSNSEFSQAFTRISARGGGQKTDPWHTEISYKTKMRKIPGEESRRNIFARFEQEQLLVRGDIYSHERKLSHGGKILLDHSQYRWTGADYFGHSLDNLAPDEQARVFSREVDISYAGSLNRRIASRLEVSPSWRASTQYMVPSGDIDGTSMGTWEAGQASLGAGVDMTLEYEKGSFFAAASAEAGGTKTKGGYNSYTGNYLEPRLDPFGNTALRMGGELYPGHRGGFFAFAGLSSKKPTLNELYGYGQGIFPNLSLQDEESFSAEAGILLEGDILQSKTVGFYNSTTNLILPVTSPRSGVGQYQNIGETRTAGVEQVLYVPLTETVHNTLGITFQESRDRAGRYAGKVLPDQPRFSFSYTMDAAIGTSFSFRPAVQYRSRVYRDRANLKPYPDGEAQGFWNIDATLMWEQGPVMVDATVFDITSGRDSTTLESGYYTLLYPGRRFLIDLKITF